MKKLITYLLIIAMTFMIPADTSEILALDNSTEHYYLQGLKVDYNDKANWAYFGIGENKSADLFLICPTTDTVSEYNMDITNEGLRKSFYYALQMERGIYEDSARMYAPYYRQASLKVYDKEVTEQEREQYLEYAYKDISDAFDLYLKN